MQVVMVWLKATEGSCNKKVIVGDFEGITAIVKGTDDKGL